VQLARQLKTGSRSWEDLADADCALLFLASGLSGMHGTVPTLCDRVMADYERASGYFEPVQYRWRNSWGFLPA
jgi:hypothetical protein